MKSRWIRTTFRLLPEVALAALTAAAGIALVQRGCPEWAALTTALGFAAIGAGVRSAARSGALAMAWRCPRLDSEGVRPGSREAPWPALRAAESVLEAMASQCGRFHDFFPGGRAHLIQTARRSLDAFRLCVRARVALRDAPKGDARQRLAAQQELAARELSDITRNLHELRAQLVAATAPLPSVADPLPALQSLSAQSAALADAVEDLRASPESALIKEGVRP